MTAAADFFAILAADPVHPARAGLIRTARGSVPTPTFMPVGTRGSVKAVGPDDLKAAGASLVLANTYHLMLRPGPELIASLGGLGAFMGWPGPTLTDSGGYQIFSLSALRKLSPEGVLFRSTYDGAKVLLTPERAVEIQQTFGVDVMMCLDECTPYPADRRQVEESMRLTLDWARRCRRAWTGPGALFGISQGGFLPELRRRSAEETTALDFPGQAVGGLALGEPLEERLAAIEAAREGLDPRKPMYLMGLGTPVDLMEGVKRGADLFDCVMPTRNARNGQLFTRFGKINILNARYKSDPAPVDERCGCLTCRRFSRAYLRHLHQNREPLFLRLASLHNLTYYLELLAGARDALLKGTFAWYYAEFFGQIEQGLADGREA
ncbi:MAG: tRNA guanosine(34) transglycosylase Tgt [Deltaproteobacteria bacterium]|jgi:queuine tRNA-ribosyltransferase|nr:tRNA guanosine(34) transglycosylase Tgt [Deltaproteobacteria bacterium]